jgi:dihydrolipoamide dehydrogenase
VPLRFVIIGGGPAGNTAATWAARLGADVTMIERDIVGGAAHLWDCIPSKTMIATGVSSRRIHGMGLEQQDAEVDIEALTTRIEGSRPLQQGTTGDQECNCCTARHVCSAITMWSHHGRGTAPLRRRVLTHRVAPHPEWCARRRTHPDHGECTRRRSSRYITVIGSGVTGVEFVHMFSSFGANVTWSSAVSRCSR